MARRVKKIGGQKQTWPIKDMNQLDNFLRYWLIRKDKAKSNVKRFQADRNWMLVMMGVNTAHRAEDLLQLRVCDVIKGYVGIKENKTNKHQSYRMNDYLHQNIVDYVARNELTDNQYLFPGQKNANFCITRQRSHNIVMEAAHAVGIWHPFGLHGLRKTFGYHFIRKDGKLLTLMKMYNHGETSVTLLYVMWDNTDAQADRHSTYFAGGQVKKSSKKESKSQE